MTQRGRAIDRALLRRVGRPCVWEKGILCPNIREDGQHDYTCTVCDGSDGERGYIYTDSTTLNMLFTSDRREKAFNMGGAWEKGSCTATVAAHVAIGDQDRVVVQDDPVRYQQHVVRAASGLVDSLRIPHVVEVLTILDISRSYTLNTDYTLSVDTAGVSTITWTTSGLSPTAAARYAVLVTMKPVWIIKGAPLVRAFGAGKKNQLLLRVDLERFDSATVHNG